ncbi:Uncharacterised protein [Klebsiella michiganensis]|nr:Uncharacterised protein [Klebsiella michiganensis]
MFPGPDDGRQAMGDNNHRPVVNQVIDSFLYRQLAIDIQRGGRLIKNDDRRIFPIRLLAMEIRWRSPPDSCPPISPIGVSQP